MGTPKTVDWERIEADYRAGVKSLREIAAAHGITEGAIRKRAKQHGWTRDLKDKVRAKADELVRKELVRTEVRKESATEKETVEVEAQVQARIRLAHRGDITRMRSLVIRLLAECEAEAADPDVFESLGEMLRNPDERGQDKLNEAYHKAISLPQRIKGVKELAEALRVLIALEREAYGIGVEEKPKTPLEDLSDEEIEARLRARLPA
jgi:hypothetical protein